MAKTESGGETEIDINGEKCVCGRKREREKDTERDIWRDRRERWNK